MFANETSVRLYICLSVQVQSGRLASYSLVQPVGCCAGFQIKELQDNKDVQVIVSKSESNMGWIQ